MAISAAPLTALNVSENGDDDVRQGIGRIVGWLPDNEGFSR